jgi:hypothetical protein
MRLWFNFKFDCVFCDEGLRGLNLITIPLPIAPFRWFVPHSTNHFASNKAHLTKTSKETVLALHASDIHWSIIA